MNSALAVNVCQLAADARRDTISVSYSTVDTRAVALSHSWHSPTCSFSGINHSLLKSKTGGLLWPVKPKPAEDKRCDKAYIGSSRCDSHVVRHQISWVDCMHCIHSIDASEAKSSGGPLEVHRSQHRDSVEISADQWRSVAEVLLTERGWAH